MLMVDNKGTSQANPRPPAGPVLQIYSSYTFPSLKEEGQPFTTNEP